MYRLLISSLVLSAALVGCGSDANQVSQNADRQIKAPVKRSDLPVPLDNPKALLGSQLFFDTNLSKERNQSCASCHDMGAAFVDHRNLAGDGAVSLGSDEISQGDRNAPTAGYAAFSPPFHQKANGEYQGGQFLDGRANGLAEQAAGPFLNPLEMALKDETAVMDRIRENPSYLEQLEDIYGEDALKSDKKAYAALTDAIAYFEQTELFMPFDSKYDRSLRGEVTLTPEEELGKTLFFSQQFTNCNACHQLQRSPIHPQETFSNYDYRNIGVPSNPNIVVHNNKGYDIGLLNNPEVSDRKHEGQFKVPSLRNVAVTGPYMHNGVFKDLRTVVLFYDKYNNRKRTLNPETGQPWREPEVARSIDFNELERAPALDDRRVDALVAFMKTLTDSRYEYLIDSSNGNL
ncbi:cytochrome-c peroxidase [Marinomonas balearica]|uniref:Cytochrome c peroxidase n=1 Tax=Marinomonas balearica TaxID=491947 RepID=A0A4R6MDX9_9GAMM|nr:cytochrome c peroxidase [Marinomonas balearica]TDO99957.1 cytochrome c peroxidase [Marinomonas balearica]